MPLDILSRKSRVERLREITKKIKDGEELTAFDLAVDYSISINVVYRDVKALKDEGYIPKDWTFTHKERGG